MSSLNIYCDGGSRGNPGPAASAYIVFLDGKRIKEEAKYLGTGTNNVAEYSAVIMAMEWLVKNNYKEVTFNLDSELVVKQLTGIYKVKNKNLLEYVLKIKNLQDKYRINIKWMNLPREKNKEADRLVNEELDNSSRL